MQEESSVTPRHLASDNERIDLQSPEMGKATDSANFQERGKITLQTC